MIHGLVARSGYVLDSSFIIFEREMKRYSWDKIYTGIFGISISVLWL